MAEQVLRSGSCSALLLWLNQARPEVLRRLHLAAQYGNTLFFLFRPLAAALDASAAPLRLALRPASGDLDIEFVKRRGPRREERLLLPMSIGLIAVRCKDVVLLRHAQHQLLRGAFQPNLSRSCLHEGQANPTRDIDVSELQGLDNDLVEVDARHGQRDAEQIAIIIQYIPDAHTRIWPESVQQTARVWIKIRPGQYVR